MSSAEGLVGRRTELALARAAVRDLSEGRASVLVIEGEAGVGKTRLVECIVEDARSRVLSVSRGDAHPFERARPFGVVAAALGLTRRSPDPRRAAVGALLRARDPLTAGSGIEYRVVEEVVDLVETECAQRPMLLVCEDLHWADEASLLAILTVTQQLPLSALMVVVTVRSSPRPADVQRVLDDLAAGGARTLHLRPLTTDSVAALARSVLGAPAGPALSVELAKAGGNPLWIVAMLRGFADEGALRPADGQVEVTTSAIPASLTDLVLRRLRDLPATTLELLEVTAVLGDSVSLRDVAAVTRRPPADVVAQLGHAFDAQLLDRSEERIAFRHPLVHEAIYHHVPPSSRRLLHREAAVVLMAGGADRLDVADQLMRGAEEGDEQAAGWLRDAGREASTQAPMLAAQLMLRAEALLPRGHADVDRVSAEAVQAALRAGMVGEATARAQAVLAREHAPEVDTPLRVALLGALALQNRSVELIALAGESLTESAQLRPSDRVLMLSQLSWALTYSGDPRGGESAAWQGLGIAEGASDPAMTVWALTALLVAVGRQGRFSEALGHARRAATLAGASRDMRALPLQPKVFLGLSLFDCDLVRDARVAFREALEDEFGSAWWLSETLMADAQVSFVLGEWEDALPGLIAGGEAAVRKGNPLLIAQSAAYRTMIATATGDHRTAGDLAAGLASSLDGEQLSYNAGVLASAVAQLKVATGDRQGAYEVLLRCWRFDMARESRFSHRFLAPDLVRLALGLGHRDVAVEVASDVTASAFLAPEVPTVRSLALRCQGLVDGDADALIEAVGLARQVPHLVWHTGTCEDAAGLLIRGGRRDTEAAELLMEALELSERAGAEAWAARVRERLRALGVHPGARGSRRRPAGGWDGLTTTERAVSRLVAEGLTNGAVARRLYISPHTVNSHLRHVFVKLGVSNRVELATVVHHSIE